MTAQQPPAGAVPPSPPVAYRNGFGITALVLGIVGIVPFGFMPITGGVALVLGILSLTFGLLGVHRVRKGVADNKKMSWAGTILGAVATTLGIVMLVMLFNITNDFVNDMNKINNQGQPPAATGPGQQRAEGGQGGDGGQVYVSPPEPNNGTGGGSGPAEVPAPSPPPEPNSGTGGGSAPQSDPATSAVTVKATGDLGTADISYSVGSNYASTSESLPFTVTEQVSNDGFTVPATISVSHFPEDLMNPTDGSIGCQVIVDGEVVDENTANTSSGSGFVSCTQPGGY